MLFTIYDSTGEFGLSHQGTFYERLASHSEIAAALLYHSDFQSELVAWYDGLSKPAVIDT